MLNPLNYTTSLSLISTKKIPTVNKQHPFLNPDFFKPLAIESRLSCTYPPEFYEVFSHDSRSQQSELAMLVLEYMTLDDKARLPPSRQ